MENYFCVVFNLMLFVCCTGVGGKVLMPGIFSKQNSQNIDRMDVFEGFEVETLLNISTCIKQFKLIFEGLWRGELWALKFLDAWGKIPSGILSNNTVSFGDFDQCINLNEAIGVELIQGQYCLAKIQVLNYMSTDPISFGVCIPSSCNVVEIQDQLIEYLEVFLDLSADRMTIFNQELCSQKVNYVLSVPDIVSISIFGIVGVLVILSTGYGYITEHMITAQSELLVAFSLLKNYRELFSRRKAVPSNQMQCLCGLWFLTIGCIIFSGNYDGIFKGDFNSSTLISHRTLLFIDILLLLSAVSTTWDVFTEISLKGSANIPRFYVDQYLRLSTVFAGVILFCATLFKHIGNGPIWKKEIEVFGSCKKYWWSALTHIQMYINSEEMCLGHSWYLSVNMQLTIVSFLILVPLYKWRSKFMWILLLLIAVLVTGAYFMQAGRKNSSEASKLEDIKFATIYGALPWLIGIILGYILFSIKGRSVKISKHILRTSWILVFLIMVASIYFMFNSKNTSDEPETMENILIKIFCRLLWSLCICWIIFTCIQGYGGGVNTILCLKCWEPLSKLSNAMLIIHYVVHVYDRATTKTDRLLSGYKNVQCLWGNFGVTLISSVIFVLFFEYPILNLEKEIWKRIEKYFQQRTYNLQAPTSDEPIGKDDRAV